MKHACLLALAICLLVPSTAEARKHCYSDETPEAAVVEDPADEEFDASASWSHDGGASWLHTADPSWVHDVDDRWYRHDDEDASALSDVAAPAPVKAVAYDPKEGAGWVHETDYGWWAGVPEAALNEVEGEDDAFDPGEEDCTVSKDRNECVVLANQTATYRFRLGLARERNDELWAEHLEYTLDRLDRRAEFMGCPWALEPTVAEQIIETVKNVIEAGIVAARVYQMFQTMGLY